jgi:predicted transport protein
VTPAVPSATVNGVTEAGKTETTVNVASSNANYVIEPLKVSFEVKKVTIVKIDWKSDYTFQWGDKAINEIKVAGYDADNVAYQMVLVFPNGYGNVGTYEITAKTPDEKNIVLGDVTAKMSVKINKKVIEVSMPDVSYIGNKGVQAVPTEFMLVVNGDIPADVRALIKYTVDGAEFEGSSEYGAYTVKAVLPTNGNYEFKGTDGKAVTELEGTMYINKQFVAGGTADAPYQIILLGENGFSADVAVKVSIPESLSRKALRGYKLHTEYTLEITGAEGATFTALIPISDTMFHKRAEALTADDLYVYEGATGTITAANKTYTVTINEGYYEVSGVSGNGSVTFVVAPEYNSPWYFTAWGIALLIFIVLAFIALLILIGFYLRRAKKDEETTVTVDEGEIIEAVPAEIEEKVDEDAFLEETADAIAEELADTEALADEADTEGTEEAVAEALDQLTAEAEELADEETTIPEDLADAKADELADEVEADAETEPEADADALAAAVAEAMADNYNESADAEGAIILASDEEKLYTAEEFKAVVDAVVADAMARTMDLPAAEETETAEVEEEKDALKEAQEALEQAAEALAEAAEALKEAQAAANTEEAEDAVEAGETAVEAAEEAVEAATEEIAPETAEETTEVEEEVSTEAVKCDLTAEDMCEIVTESVNEAFEAVTVDGAAPAAVEGTTLETIEDAVDAATDANVPGNWTVDMAKTVKEAVVAELAARLLTDEEPPVEEEAVEAVAIVEEPVVEEVKPETDEDDDDDAEGEEEESSFAGFGSMPLSFIDAIEDADQYAAWLEQEARGEVQLVTRYRRSFQSRLIQSQGNVQEYYNILKNALLSYKGVKSRTSWNYEAYNRGRVHVAKMNAKTKTLYLYLALDPEELKDTKYGIVDVSSKKKYASVPVLMKIKGERKFKYALELIEKLCGENLQLPKLDLPEVDYRVPYQTTEALVEAGVVKKMVASIPVTVYGAESTEEAPVAEASAPAEAKEVTFVAPTDAPAVEAAAEEVAADAEVKTDAPTEI